MTLEAASLEGERAPVLVRFEAVFGRRFAARRDAPFRLELEGDVGGVGRLAALELRVSATTAVDDDGCSHPSLRAAWTEGDRDSGRR